MEEEGKVNHICWECRQLRRNWKKCVNNGVGKFEHKCTGCEKIGEGPCFYCTTCMGHCHQ